MAGLAHKDCQQQFGRMSGHERACRCRKTIKNPNQQMCDACSQMKNRCKYCGQFVAPHEEYKPS